MRGSATITIGDETIYTKKDDMVFIPEGAMYSYHNAGEEPFEFLCIIPSTNGFSLQAQLEKIQSDKLYLESALSKLQTELRQIKGIADKADALIERMLKRMQN